MTSLANNSNTTHAGLKQLSTDVESLGVVVCTTLAIGFVWKLTAAPEAADPIQ